MTGSFSARSAQKNKRDFQTPKLVSLVVPVFNEQDSIGKFVERIHEVLDPMAPATDYQIVFVNDGSQDATEFAIRSLMKNDAHIALLNLSRNFGKDSALCAGLEHAVGDAVIPMDVDLQDAPEVIPEMIVKWREGTQIVNARRVDRSKDSWIKQRSAAAFYKVFNSLAERPIPANVGDYRLLDRQVVDVVREIGEKSRFNKSIFSWVGFDTAEVTFQRPERIAGRSSWSYWKLWNFALDGIFTSSTVPLRVWSYVGTILSLASFGYAAFILFYTLFLGADTPGYASTVILILLFGGLNLLAVGIIGEYVGRIFNEVRDRPIYIVRSAHGLKSEK
ncbi:glycosyltransferase family 2 protein [Ruegeria arenilitoris]|uniref:glycosyltransferase family 2 protein n=1 Tax=Ruegeria arenilitoris TaxID=1173585 RepID=UPI0014813004|nr:glycosyltransferase family 2 protein [Ruegeria arenilitoris]